MSDKLFLCHAMEKTANRNTGNPLYSILDGITPNLPTVHCIDFVGCFIFHGITFLRLLPLLVYWASINVTHNRKDTVYVGERYRR